MYVNEQKGTNLNNLELLGSDEKNNYLWSITVYVQVISFRCYVNTISV